MIRVKNNHDALTDNKVYEHKMGEDVKEGNAKINPSACIIAKTQLKSNVLLLSVQPDIRIFLKTVAAF